MDKNSLVTIIVIFVWLFIVLPFFFKTPSGGHNHDYGGHIEYSELLAKKHAIPKPYEGWQTYHPPLYYLINYYLTPSILTQRDYHTIWVRALSIVYGLISIIIMGWFMRMISVKPVFQLISTLFICTLVKFIFVFTSYNNDSLTTVLGFAMLAISYKLYKDWSLKYASILLAASTAALYTKYSAVLIIGVITIICCKDLLQKKLPTGNALKIIGVLVLSFVLFSPWLIFHNYKETKKLFPNNSENGLGQSLAINDDRPSWKVVFRIPILQQDPHEWDDPWAHGYTRPETKKHDYWAFVHITSIYSENAFEAPGVFVAWSLLWIHLICIIIGLSGILKNGITKASGALIILGHLSHIALFLSIKSAAASAMDYRYICWIWLGWIILYANRLADDTRWGNLLKRLMIIAIAIQIIMIFSIQGDAT